jgi:hypothetical protein
VCTLATMLSHLIILRFLCSLSCGVDGVRTTWHKFFQDSALPWECHMSIPPELLHHIVPRVGLEPTRLTALVPKTSVATITPPRQLFHQQIKDHFCFSTLQRYGILSYRQTNRKNFLSYFCTPTRTRT